MADLSVKQEAFLSYLFDPGSETRGNSMESALAAGYSRDYHSTLVKKLREEIRARTLDGLTGLAAKAVMQIEDSLEEDGSVPKGDIRLKAAESILDRMGAGKQQGIDITSDGEAISPLFILPAKVEVEVDGEYDDYEE